MKPRCRDGFLFWTMIVPVLCSLAPLLGGLIAAASPCASAAEMSDVRVEVDAQIVDDSEGFTVTASATLKWEWNGPPNPFRIKHDGDVVVPECGPNERSYTIVTVERYFGSAYSADDKPFALEWVEDELARSICGQGFAGTWEVELVCGSGHGEDELWPAGGAAFSWRHFGDMLVDRVLETSKRPMNPVIYSRTLFTYPCRGMNVEFTIQYSGSSLTAPGPMGAAWTHSYNVYLERVDWDWYAAYPHNYIMHLGLESLPVRGHVSGYYTCPDPYAQFADIESGTKLRVRIRGMEYIFEWYPPKNYARIESITVIKGAANESQAEDLGHTLRFEYYDDGGDLEYAYRDGELASITDSSGRTYTFTYWDTSEGDGHLGALKSVEHPNDSGIHLADFLYRTEPTGTWVLGEVLDAEGQSTAFDYAMVYFSPTTGARQYALAKVSPSVGVNTYYGHKASYGYDDPATEEFDDKMFLVSYTDKTHGTNDTQPDQNPYGKVTVRRNTDIDPFCNVITTYREVVDGVGAVETFAYGKEASRRGTYPLLWKTDGEGNKTSYRYDEYDNCVRESLTDGISYWLITVNRYYESDPEEAKWGNAFRTITRKVQEEDFDPDDPYGSYDSYYEYLEDLLESDPDHRYEYDDWGRETCSVDSTGIESHTQYQTPGGYVSGLLEKTWIEPDEPDDTPSKEVDYEYETSGDNEWLLIRKTEQLGPSQNGLVTEYSYDADDGMLTQALVKEGDTGPTITETDYTYDEDGIHLGVPVSIVETGQNGPRQTDFTYDLLNRVTSKTLPAAESGADRYRTEWVYHWYDDVEDVVKYYGSESGGWDEIEKTRKVYSSDSGWLEAEWVYADPSSNDPTPTEARKTSYTYYDNGMLETVTSPRQHDDTGDPLNVRTKYLYFDNQLKKEVQYYEDASTYTVESFTYYPDGQVATSTNCREKMTEYQYDEYGRQCKVIDALDGETTYEYDAATTRVTCETTPAGEEKHSAYDKFGRLEEERVIMGVYDAEPERPQGDPDDIVTKHSCDDATGQLVRTAVIRGADDEDPERPSGDPDDFVTAYEYDVQGRQGKVTYAPGTDDETTVEYTYTAPGSLESEKRFIETGTPDRYIVTEYAYDELDRQKTVTVVMPGDDIVTTYAYDVFHLSGSDPYVLRTDTVVDALGNETETTYDVFGEVAEVKSLMGAGGDDDIVMLYEYDKNGNATEETDAEGTITEFEYDYRDRLIKTTYAAGTGLEGNVQLTLDENGNVTTSKDQLGKETDYTYDDLDRLTKTDYADGTSVSLTRDAMGRVTQHKDQLNRKTTFEYDDAGRLKKTTGPDGKSIVVELDAAGNVEVRTDQMGNQTEYTYDGRGQLRITTYEDSTTVQRTYDGVGNLKTLTDQRNNTTGFTYDDAARLVKTTYPDANYEELTFDALGNMKVRRDRNGKETNYDYDELGRLTTVQYPDNGNTITRTYDKMGRVKSVLVEDYGSTQLSYISCDYDQLGRLREQTQELGAGTDKTVAFDYDKVGNRTGMDYPGGTGLTIHYDDVYRLKRIIGDDDPTHSIVNYRYNAAGEVERLDLKNGARTYYTYDAVGRLATLVNRDPGGLKISSYAYQRNAVGCPTRITYHDGRYRFYDYDDLYRLTREEHWTPQQANLLWHDYDYDPAGNRTSKQYDSDSGPELGYAYNNMNQLTDQAGTTGSRADVAGTVSDENLASVTVWNTAPEPDKDFGAQLRQRLFIARAVELEENDNDLYALALDKAGNESRYPENETEFHTVTLDSSVDLDYVYDANGCLIRIEEGGTVLKEYVYDYENRLIEVVEDPGGTPVTLAEYQYDGLGRRVWSKVGGVETRFIYDGESVIEEYLDDNGWELAAVYVHGAGTDSVLAVTRDGQTFYYHYDGLGSVTELTDADGLLAQAYEYDAWGIPTIYDPEHASGNPYLFTGRRWDAALSLYYYRARHYAPDLGRFLQPDPIGYEQTTNLYAYVGSSPTILIDPTGLGGLLDDDGSVDTMRSVSSAEGAARVHRDRLARTVSNQQTMDQFDAVYEAGEQGRAEALEALGTGAANVAKGAVGLFDSLVVRPLSFLRTSANVVHYAPAGGPFGGLKVVGYGPGEPIPSVGSQLGIGDSRSYVRGEGLGRLAGAAGQAYIGARVRFLPVKGFLGGDAVSEGLASAEQVITGRRACSVLPSALYEGATAVGLNVDPQTFNELYEDMRLAALLYGGWEATRVKSAAAVPDEAVLRTQGGRAAPVTNPRSNAQTLTETQGATKPVRPIGGRLPSNYRYAGKTYYLKDPQLAAKYPGGVPFTESGFPDFSRYAVRTVKVKGLTGTAGDAALADKAAGLARTPAGYTWHHVEDGVTMELVPRELNSAVGHTGGAAVRRHGGP
jgi:RHS repeat-associated protein